MNITKIKNLLNFWVKELRLQDWDITLRLVETPNDLPNTTYAVTKGNVKYKRAEITVNNPDWISKDMLLSSDLEVTLVHELLHLRFPGSLTSDSDTDEEGIERVAEALVNLKRKKN